MNKILSLAVMCMLGLAGATLTTHAAAEEKVEVKTNKDGSWKMKIKRKNDKEWIGSVNGREYSLRGDVDYSKVNTNDEYTVWGDMAPDQTYITTTKIVRVEGR